MLVIIMMAIKLSLYKTLIGPEPMRIRFDKTVRFIRFFDGFKYLVLLCPEKYDAIYNRIRYLISLKSGITIMFSLLCENRSGFLWFFTYIKKIDLCCNTQYTKCYNTH